ncbi:MAG: hypothetical protein KQH59_09915 [Desulfobulbaceae bacterium]|nr:hypothetical protein [Desulfobulbaceae bacterium]
MKEMRKMVADFFDFYRESITTRATKKLNRICRSAIGMGFSHPRLEEIWLGDQPNQEEVILLQQNTANCFTRLANGELAIDTQPAPILHFIGGSSETSSRISAKLQVEGEGGLSEAMLAILSLALFFAGVKGVLKCPGCGKYFPIFDGRSKSCSAVCRQRKRRNRPKGSAGKGRNTE